MWSFYVMLPCFYKHDPLDTERILNENVPKTFRRHLDFFWMSYVWFNLRQVSRRWHAWVWVVLNLSYFTQALDGRRMILCCFCIRKMKQYVICKICFFSDILYFGPLYATVLNDLRFPLISKQNMPFMDQVDHIIHFWFLKQITLEYCKKHTPTYTTEIMPFKEIFSIYNHPFTNFLCNFMCTKVSQETWFMND